MSLTFYELLIVTVMISVGIIIGLSVKLIRKKIKEKSIRVVFDRYYDIYEAILKDILRSRETFNSYIDLLNRIDDYPVETLFDGNKKARHLDGDSHEILKYGIISYVLKNHEYESKLIVKNKTHDTDYDMGTESVMDDDVLSRFGGKVVAHTKDPEVSTMRQSGTRHTPTATELTEARNRYYIERGMIPPKPGEKNPDPEMNSMMPFINNFYEE